MSILIADSGSTKTEWILSKKEGDKTTIFTEGLNPYFKNHEAIQTVVWEELLPKVPSESIDEIYFYGAGCSTKSNQDILKKALNVHYKQARIYVDTDLLGAAIACLGNQSGIACILGTGSNACMYDGSKIIKQIPSLGFSLGDEGSGGFFGKRILRDYFYKKMPQDIRRILDEKYDMDLNNVLERVYHQTAPNRFVASFARILAECAEHEYIKQVVKVGFSEFVNHQLYYFGDISEQKLGFVGSIAAIHKDILAEVLTLHGLQKPFSIVQKPIENIVRYHQLKN
jgi:N-acetylglucosamine kinase-like BadF-type ATPase